MIPREDSLSTIESPMLEHPEGSSTVEMETCSEEPRVNVGNLGADDMDVLDTVLETPEPPRHAREKPVATLDFAGIRVVLGSIYEVVSERVSGCESG